jgi:hypothetical protein
LNGRHVIGQRLTLKRQGSTVMRHNRLLKTAKVEWNEEKQ